MRYIYLIIGLLICGILIAADSPQTPPAYVKVKQWKNVKDYGAVGDSATDDYAAIQALLDVVTGDTGVTIYVPTGRYRLTQPLKVNTQDKQRLTILGSGWGSKFIIDNDTGGISCSTNTISGALQMLLIKDISIVNDSTANNAPDYGLKLYGQISFGIENVAVDGGGWMDYGIHLIGSQQGYIHGGLVKDNVCGIALDTLAAGTKCNEVTISSMNIRAYGTSTEGNTAYTYGVKFQALDIGGMSWNHLYGCSTLVFTNRLARASIEHNLFEDCLYGLYIDSSSHSIINDNFFTNADKGSIYFNRAMWPTVTNNLCSDSVIITYNSSGVKLFFNYFLDSLIDNVTTFGSKTEKGWNKGAGTFDNRWGMSLLRGSSHLNDLTVDSNFWVNTDASHPAAGVRVNTTSNNPLLTFSRWTGVSSNYYWYQIQPADSLTFRTSASQPSGSESYVDAMSIKAGEKIVNFLGRTHTLGKATIDSALTVGTVVYPATNGTAGYQLTAQTGGVATWEAAGGGTGWDWADSAGQIGNYIDTTQLDTIQYAHKSVLSDSTVKIDTNYAPFQTYVSDHAGAGAGDEIKVDSAGAGTTSVAMTSPVVIKQGSNIDLVIINNDTVQISASAGASWNWTDSAGEPPFWVDSATYATSSGDGWNFMDSIFKVGDFIDTTQLDTIENAHKAVLSDSTSGGAARAELADSTQGGAARAELADSTQGGAARAELADSTTGGAARAEFADSAATVTWEALQDIIGAMLTGNTETNITVTYQDADGTIDFVVTASGSGDSALSLVQTSGDSTEIVKWVGDSLMIVWVGGDTCWWYKGTIDCGDGALAVDSIFVLNGTDTARITNVFIDSIRAGSFGGGTGWNWTDSAGQIGNYIDTTQLDTIQYAHKSVVADSAIKIDTSSIGLTALNKAKDSVAAWDNGAYPIPTTYATKANIHDSLVADTNVFIVSFNRLKDSIAAARVDIRDTVNIMGIIDSTAAGTGMSETGNTLNVNGTTGITVEADTVKADTTLLATWGRVEFDIEDSLDDYLLTATFNLVADDTVKWDSLYSIDSMRVTEGELEDSLDAYTLLTDFAKITDDSAKWDSLYLIDTMRVTEGEIEDSLDAYTLTSVFNLVADDTVKWDSVYSRDTMRVTEGELEDSLDAYTATSGLMVIDSTVAGTGLTESGNTINANGANGITVAADTIKVDTTTIATKQFVRDSGAIEFISEAEDLTIIGNVKVYGEVYQNDRAFILDTSATFYSKPPDTFLHLLQFADYPTGTPWDSCHMVHPSVVAFPGGFGLDSGSHVPGTPADTVYNNAKAYFWMTATPYFTTADSENPNLYWCLDNDPSGQFSWTQPFYIDQYANTTWVAQPILGKGDIQGSVAHLSDENLGYTRDGKLCIVTNVCDATGDSLARLIAITSPDGFSWDKTNDTMTVLGPSPSKVYYMSPTWAIAPGANEYWAWTVNMKDAACDTTQVVRYKASRIDSTWNSTGTVCNFITGTALSFDSMNIWHMSVKRYGNQLHMLINIARDSTRGYGGAEHSGLWKAISDDGINWTVINRPYVTATNRLDVDSLYYYRSDEFWVNDARGGYFQVIASVKSAGQKDHIVSRKVYVGSYIDIFADVFGQDHTPEDSIELYLPTQTKAGDTSRLFVDSSYDAGGDDCYDTFAVVFDVPQNMYVDTAKFCMATTGSLDSIEFWGKDFSGGLNLNDSLYQTYTTAFTTTTPTVVTIALQNLIKSGKAMAPGNRITAVFYTKHADANDKLTCYWAKLRGYPK